MTVLLHQHLGSWLDSNLNRGQHGRYSGGNILHGSAGAISRWLLVTKVCQQKAGTNNPKLLGPQIFGHV